QLRKRCSRDCPEHHVVIGQVYSNAVEPVGDRRTRGTAAGEVGPEHEVIDEKLGTPLEKICQRSASLVGVEPVSLVDRHPREVLPLSCELVTAPGEFFLRLKQFEPCLQPLFACSSLVRDHYSDLLSFLPRCNQSIAMGYIYRGAL